MKQNTLPKSLHTITVLVNVARIYLDGGHERAHCVSLALAALGYDGTPDTYELASKARAILTREVQS
jgi:hypothetical protein